MLNDDILVEACVTSVAEATHAEAAGADRLELCVNLSVGGVTPPTRLVEAVLDSVSLPVQVLVRSRPGDFHYSDEEIDTMCDSAREAAEAGASGIVFGALTAEGEIDQQAALRVKEAAGSVGITMHRAFDASKDALDALEACAAVEFERILTSGHAASAEEGIETLKTLVKRVVPSTAIMPGGVIRSFNVVKILQQTGATEVHARASAIQGVISAVRNSSGG